MKNHFYIAYSGNKRNEVKEIYDNIDLTNITTIIEPFCGSCAISYYISTKKEGLKYVLNDNNKNLKEMYELLLDDNKITKFEEDYKNLFIDINKEKYMDLINQEGLLYWFLKNKYCCIRPGLYPTLRTFKEINLKEYPIYNFFRNNIIEFTNEDGVECYKKYKDKEHNLIFLDPPYISSCNDWYIAPSLLIYEFLYNNNINKEKAKIYLILENSFIIKILFNSNKKILEYAKKYERSKKKTTHIIITKNDII